MSRKEVSKDRKVMIRPMTATDLDEVISIEAVSYTTPWSRRMFEAELAGNAFAHLFVARDPESGALRGYVCCWVVFDELHLMNLSVHPEWRRLGIGEELARWTLSWAREQGARSATLEVRVSNEAARRLYEKLGFTVSAVRRDYYRDPKEDAQIMNRSKW
ncbi:MAG: ribosomal protein S18-alanine N-acetyltransferase [Nitrospirae bacterium]|nr:ribosomal protein S18-alanine N-acetyltransferase [Nitrospirota bacterium]